MRGMLAQIESRGVQTEDVNLPLKSLNPTVEQQRAAARSEIFFHYGQRVLHRRTPQARLSAGRGQRSFVFHFRRRLAQPTAEYGEYLSVGLVWIPLGDCIGLSGKIPILPQKTFQGRQHAVAPIGNGQGMRQFTGVACEFVRGQTAVK